MATRVTLKSRFPEIERSLALRVSAAVKATANAVIEDAKANTHDVTGELDDSMEAVRQAVAEYLVVVSAMYAHWVEFGRKNAPPYPFLLPAAESQLAPFEDRVREALAGL